MLFDCREMKCPLAFVKAKQQLLKNKTKVFLFNEDISLYNFCRYLDNEKYRYTTHFLDGFVQLTVEFIENTN